MDMEYNTEWYREYRLCPVWDRGFSFTGDSLYSAER